MLQSGPFPLSVFPARLVLLLLLIWGTTAWSQPAAWRKATHPRLAADRLASTKLSAADKGGAEGDAAAASDRYDMLRYHLNLRVDPEINQLEGHVKMVFSSLAGGLDVMVFDLGGDLELLGVEHLSGPLTFTHLADSVSVDLPVGLASGQTDSFTVHYGGRDTEPSFNRGLMFRTYTLGGHQGTSVASMSQPAYAKYWWPCKDKPGDKALSQVDVTVPDHLTAVSNGNLLGTATAGPGWHTFSWREDYPIASYLISVAIADYVLLEDHCSTVLGSEIPIFNYVFPPDADDAAVDFAPVCEMMDLCEGHFGPYPFQGEKYGHAEFLWTGAMEHQTATSIGYGSILGDGSRDWLIVHELGHQWFGDSLTPDTWADIWLNEGFATYSEALWTEHLHGHDAYLARLAYWRSPGSWEVQGPVYDPVPVFPGRVIYDKGAWMLHMLRGRVGDEVFFDLLEDWAQGGGRPLATVTTEEFIGHAETWSGQELDDFFWPYLTTTVTPRVAVDFSLEDGTAGPESLVDLTLRQVQSPLFDNIFPVAVTTELGTEVHQVALAAASAQTRIQAPAAVLDVQLDPEGWVLWEPAGGSGPAEGLISAYPNPSVDRYVVLGYRLTNASQVVLRIYDARGREVSSRTLGLVMPELGGNEVAWNQKDSAGRTVASGVYWAVLDIDGRRSVRKIAIAR
jgi:aminopeptidase N